MRQKLKQGLIVVHFRLKNIWILVVCLFLSAADSHTIVLTDLAETYAITGLNTYGGEKQKDYILETTGNGIVIFDFDSDGNDDVLLMNGASFNGLKGALPYLYRNVGNGKFEAVGKTSGLTFEGWAQGACSGDVNNDGRPDLMITYYGHNRLYKNLGTGSFEEVTAKSGLPVTGNRYGSGCTFLDYDRDGRLDLFVSNYVDLDLKKTPKKGVSEACTWKEIPVMCGPRGLPLAKNVLYHQEADGTFKDVSEKAGILKPGGRYGLQAVSADFDNDGRPDIYVACDMTPSLLFHNSGDGTFEERGEEAGVAYNFDGRLQAGMGVAVADFDNDGWLDIAKTNFSGDTTSLYRNEDGKYFSDVSREAGLGVRQLLGWGVAWVDFDDDGLRDLLVVNGHVYPEVEGTKVGDKYLQETLLFRNLGSARFADISKEAGPGLATPRPSRGLALGDLDRDGRPEAVILNMNARPTVLHNSGVRTGKFVNLRLEGTKSNRSAIGARVTVEAGGKKWIDEVMSGASYYSQHSAALHFGLGAVKGDLKVSVKWPSGLTQSWSGVPVDSMCRLKEGVSASQCSGYSQ